MLTQSQINRIVAYVHAQYPASRKNKNNNPDYHKLMAERHERGIQACLRLALDDSISNTEKNDRIGIKFRPILQTLIENIEAELRVG